MHKDKKSAENAQRDSGRRRMAMKIWRFGECPQKQRSLFACIAAKTSHIRRISKTRCLGRIQETGAGRRIPTETKSWRIVLESKQSLPIKKEHMVILSKNPLPIILSVQTLTSILPPLRSLQYTIKLYNLSSPNPIPLGPGFATFHGQSTKAGPRTVVQIHKTRLYRQPESQDRRRKWRQAGNLPFVKSSN